LLIRNIKKVAGVQSDKHNTLAPEQTDMLEMSFTRFNLESLKKGLNNQPTQVVRLILRLKTCGNAG
jgi:hypothetical protein